MTDKANAGDNGDGNERKKRWAVWAERERERERDSGEDAEKQAKSFN